MLHRILEGLLIASTSFSCSAFVSSRPCTAAWYHARLSATPSPEDEPLMSRRGESRRSLLRDFLAFSTTAGLANQGHRLALADFTPGGTLVDREVGVTVGNAQASSTRKADNSNVLFAQDYYFKFGTAAQWIEPDSTEFPKTMPFVRIQQRYDALKKYGSRIQGGLDNIAGLNKLPPSQIADPAAADVYQLRPMGLLANNMLASENTGSTNELFLARWYINEIYLLVNDIRSASSDGQAKEVYAALKSATNSYLSMMNRVITPKVGDQFPYL